MHKYLRSIGFRGIDNEDYRLVLNDLESHADQQFMVEDEDSDEIVEYVKEYDFGIGISSIGRIDSLDGFVRDYSFPYYEGLDISSNADVEIVRASDRDCYQGILEDNRIGIDLIFFVTDPIHIVKNETRKTSKINTGRVKLSGLASEGKILFQLVEDKINIPDPILKKDRAKLYEQAREGDPDAIDELSSKDYDTYNVIQERLKSEDTLTILQSYIMPVGIECDKYSILGTILSHSKLVNLATNQTVIVMKVVASGIIIDVVINEKDLMGEIQDGRRFKGEIWLQGRMF